MYIFVCIKQVPATNKVEVDEKTGHTVFAEAIQL